MARPRTLWDHLRWDLAALAILALLFAGWAMLQDPSFQPAESPRTDGSKPPDHSEGDILLVLPTAPAAEAHSFQTLDCSFGWFNALRQHFGTFATTGIDNISPQLLAGHSVAIVPSRVAGEASSSVRRHLEEFARDGGQLIVEMPRGDSWASTTGIVTSTELHPVRSITSAAGLGEHGPVYEHLPEVPLAGHLLEAPDLEARPAGPVVFEVEERPGLIAEPLGRGKVLALMFDFSCSLTAMYQGLPDENFRFGPPDGPPRLPTDRRIADETLADTEVPYAHILKRVLFDRLSETRPTARLWAYPGDYRGAAITTHPAPEDLRPAFAYADRARRQDAASTIFAAADRFTANHRGLADQVGADVGLLWVLGERRPHVTEGVGIGALQPWERELTLPRQRSRLSATMGQRSPRLVQTEDTLWDNDWDSTFAQIAGAGLDVDTSFGPTDPDRWGYLFGTGMPYYPLDRRGRPLPVLEMPFALSGANLSVARLRSLLEASDTAFHQPITVNLGADAMAREPSVGLMLGFRDFHELSRNHDHWVTTVGDFVDFQSARRQSVLTSQWSEQRRRLTVSVNLVGARLPTAADGAVPAVAVPAHYQGASIMRVEVDDDDVTVGTAVTTGPGDERLIELPPGRHVVTVYYHSPDDEGS